MTHARPDRRGFALIEAIVATVMLGVGLAGLIGLTSAALASQRTGEQLEIAAMLADEQLGLLFAAGPERYERLFTSSGPCPEPHQRFTYDIDIDNRSGGDPSIVTCTIFWEAGGRDRELVIETLLAPRLGDDPMPDRQPQSSTPRSARQ